MESITGQDQDQDGTKSDQDQDQDGTKLDQVKRNSDESETSELTEKKDLREKLVDIFNRDWRSPHCKFIK
jgi:hypothetical protein